MQSRGDIEVELSTIWEAIALLNSMVRGGEDHTEKSRDVLHAACNAFDEVQLYIGKAEYNKLPTSKKPKCKAMTYSGRGYVAPCERKQEYNSDYCYSHRNWKEQS